MYPKTTKLSAISNKSTVEATRLAREELKQRMVNWKRKAWLDFCKLVMEEDKRYTLMPVSDYNNKMGKTGLAIRAQNADGVFSNFCLTRTGDMADVYLLPCDPMLGVCVDAGSKYTMATVQSFPSKAMIWPVIRIADELERQFAREVIVESKKHTKGGTHATHSSGANSDSDTDELSTNS